jgi:hypothetical protein
MIYIGLDAWFMHIILNTWDTERTTVQDHPEKNVNKDSITNNNKKLGHQAPVAYACNSKYLRG